MAPEPAHRSEPLPTSSLTVLDNGKTWQINVSWQQIQGRPEPVMVTLSSIGADGPLPNLSRPQPTDRDGFTYLDQDPFAVTAALIRKLPIGQHLATMRQMHARGLNDEATALRSIGASDHAQHVADLAYRWGTPQRGAPLRLEVLTKVADEYRHAQRLGTNVYATIAAACGISPSTASKRIMAARRAGLLGPAVPGRAGEATNQKGKS
ncbi:unannotated protein [freshwater metagenome]|uniref:Unannotated protein n=1 Tax=freshwater metagenome TaxID=449393 RepID=A0A6J6QR47_9ZZZZ